MCFVLAIAAAVSIALNTDLMAPPRFDGAGYAVLGNALASGRGYREIDTPESPRHAHFPPGYPAALALLWRCAGRSVPAAHLFSIVCTLTAVLLAWKWFRTLYPPRTAFILGLSLALNWTWARIGGSIQSEPFYLLCELLAILATVRTSRRDSIAAGVVLGVILAACVLIRHVGVCVAAAMIIDLALRRQWRAVRTTVPIALALILPWAGWLLAVHQHTQAGLFVHESAAARIAGQAIFYLQRLPDQIHGPLVEVATVFRRSVMFALLATLWAAAASGTIIWGWVSTLRTPRRRLAGLSALTTLSLLLIWPFTEAGRFLIPIVPFLLVGATEGLARVMTFARLRRSRLWAAGIILAVSVPYAVHAIATGRAEAQRLTYADFDAACAWIVQHAPRPGPVLTRHPGEVFWQTGRLAVAPDSPDPAAIDRLIDRLGVRYLLIDEDRYANAGSNPLRLYVESYPSRSALIWDKIQGTASIQIREAIRPD
jgi:hypothetical protein